MSVPPLGCDSTHRAARHLQQHIDTRSLTVPYHAQAVARVAIQWKPSNRSFRCHGKEWSEQWAEYQVANAAHGFGYSQQEPEEAAQGESWYVCPVAPLTV